MKKILINGAQGRMGQETVKAIEADAEFQLVAKTGHQDNLESVIAATLPDIVIDFTRADSVYENAKRIIQTGAHPVIGTSGLQLEQVQMLQALCYEKRLGGIIAPNFSIGAVLMMKYSREIARYFPHVEIIELHHDKKQDAPSGTAIKTADMITKSRREKPQIIASHEILPGARGAVQEGIHIHSIRLPGLVAHQEVIFGGQSETLTIRHDSIHRESFMPGVILACKKVMELNELVYGLENIID